MTVAQLLRAFLPSKLAQVVKLLRCRVRISGRDTDYLRLFIVFPQSLLTNAAIIHLIRPRTLHSASFLIHLACHATVLTVS
jgi:hypothetical protein